MSCFGRRPNNKKLRKLYGDPPLDRNLVQHNRTDHAENFRSNVTHVTLQRVLVINGKYQHASIVTTANSNRRTGNNDNTRSNDQHLCNLNNIHRVGSQRSAGVQRDVMMCYTTNPNISYIMEPHRPCGHVTDTDHSTRYIQMNDARRGEKDDEIRRRRMTDYQLANDLSNTVPQRIALFNKLPQRPIYPSNVPQRTNLSNGAHKELSSQNNVPQGTKVSRNVRQEHILPGYVQQEGVLPNYASRRIVLPSTGPQEIVEPQGPRKRYSVNQTEDTFDLEQVLDDLNDTLDSYCSELDVYHSTNKTESDSGVDSGSESFDSSIPPIIETTSETKPGRKRLSVSFLLPVDHVDKPYSPIQFSKSRRRYHTSKPKCKGLFRF